MQSHAHGSRHPGAEGSAATPGEEAAGVVVVVVVVIVVVAMVAGVRRWVHGEAEQAVGEHVPWVLCI